MAAEVRDDTITQPLEDRVLRPEVMQLRPGVFFATRLAGILDGLGHELGVSAQRVQVIGGLHFARQLTQAVLQVARSGDADDLLGVVMRPLAERLALVELGERGLGEVVIAGEQRIRLIDLSQAVRLLGFLGLFCVPTEKLEQPVTFVGFVCLGGVVQRGLDNFRAQAVGHERRDLFSLLVRIEHVQESGGVTEVQVGLLILGLENFQDAQVAAHARVGGLGEEVDDLRLVLLAIAIHATVTLLEHHERPRQIEVHQPVAEVMQVEAFAGDVRAEQHAQAVIQATKALDQRLLFGVGHLTVQHRHLIGFQTEVAGQLLLQPAQGFDTLGEDHETVIGGADLPVEVRRLQEGEQALVLAE